MTFKGIYRSLIVASLILSGYQEMASAQQMNILSGKSIPAEWGIARQDLFQFSAVAPVSKEGNDYIFAVVTDKGHDGGLFYLSMSLRNDGSVEGTGLYPMEGTISSSEVRDPEGIAKVGDFFWVSGEDQRILEYDGMGMPTGRELTIPDDMTLGSIQPNLGFEALCYDAGDGARPARLIATTENSIRADKSDSPDDRPLLRIQTFDPNTLLPAERYSYRMDAPSMTRAAKGATYVYGVSDILSLDDGRLVVMEREVCANVRKLKVRSAVKLYTVDLSETGEDGTLRKTLLKKFSTGLKGLRITLANYEGMCRVTMPDGTDALLLVNDSQGQMGYTFGKLSVRLSDYVRVVRL